MGERNKPNFIWRHKTANFTKRNKVNLLEQSGRLRKTKPGRGNRSICSMSLNKKHKQNLKPGLKLYSCVLAHKSDPLTKMHPQLSTLMYAIDSAYKNIVFVGKSFSSGSPNLWVKTSEMSSSLLKAHEICLQAPRIWQRHDHGDKAGFGNMNTNTLWKLYKTVFINPLICGIPQRVWYPSVKQKINVTVTNECVEIPPLGGGGELEMMCDEFSLAVGGKFST